LLPEDMTAVLLTGHGGLDKLEYRTDVAVPQPDRGEVLIEVAAAGINNTTTSSTDEPRRPHRRPPRRETCGWSTTTLSTTTSCRPTKAATSTSCWPTGPRKTWLPVPSQPAGTEEGGNAVTDGPQ
jgi:hypothetical protein